MKKNCFNCEFYGKCAVTQSICTDWSNKKPSRPSLDIMNFNLTWQYMNFKSIWTLLSDITKKDFSKQNEKAFKKWYNRDWSIPLKEQIDVNNKYLNGRTTEEMVEEATNIAYNTSLDKMKEQMDEEKR